MHRHAFLTLTLVAGIAVAALAQGGSLRHINPTTLSAPGGYTHVVISPPGGRLVFIAGQVPVDKSGAVVGKGDFRAQATQVFNNVKLAVEAAGGTMADIAKMNTYATDLSQVNALREVRQQHFKSNPPAGALVQVVGLARPEFMLEVEAIAVVK